MYTAHYGKCTFDCVEAEREEGKEEFSGNRSRPLLCELLTFSTSQWEPPPHTISDHFIKDKGEKTAKREL